MEYKYTVMKTFKQFNESENVQTHKWALVQKNGPHENRVEVHHHNNNQKAPHPPGRGAVWYVKKEKDRKSTRLNSSH